MVVLKVGVDVSFPVKGIDEVLVVVLLLFGKVLHEQRARDGAAFDERLIHAENVASPLGLVCHEAARGVEDAGRDEPARPRLQAVRLRIIENAVIPFVPTIEAADNLLLGRTGLETEEGVGKIIPDGVQLRREIIRFGLSFLPREFRLLVALMHVMGNGPHVVKEFRIHGPT